MSIKVGMGQDSHRFLSDDSSKTCIIAGVSFNEVPGFKANSDGDIVYHAICNAISSVTGVLILGALADDLCLKDGITDSRVFLEKAVETLEETKIVHIAVTLEAKKPKFKNKFDEMKQNIASVCHIDTNQVGITATTGEGLTDFGLGLGAQAMAIVTFLSP